MPQLVAIFNGVGGGAAALISIVELLHLHSLGLQPAVYVTAEVLLGVLIGSVSFAGSAIAFVKLQELITGRPITLEFAKEALSDLLALQAKLVTVENIQKTVAEYYKIRIADLLSKRRSRSIARPRQVAMALAKELTNYSLPEIGDAFGGRDHTTVLHACRRIKELRESERRIAEDYLNLLRTLAG